ncbi:hypothetical protein PSYAE_06030 [Pseudomonas amygdali pv. aesculi str. 0893_23]|nr:hypothetical protein PSYAE_06030 [Pseudomonas amygdali pv. aesculi str. 0893_23]
MKWQDCSETVETDETAALAGAVSIMLVLSTAANVNRLNILIASSPFGAGGYSAILLLCRKNRTCLA